MDDIIFLVVLAFAALLGYVVFEIWPFAKAYLKSMNNPAKPMMLMFQRNGILRMLTADYVSQVYEYESGKELLAFSKNDSGAFKFGKVIVDVFYDAANMAQRPEFWLICHAFLQAGYTGWDQVKNDILITKKLKPGTGKELGVRIKGRFVMPDGSREEKVMEISDVAVARGDADEGEIFVPLFSQVNPHDTLPYVEGTAAILKGYADTKVNIVRAEKYGGILNNPSVMGLGFIVICLCFGVGILKVLKVF